MIPFCKQFETLPAMVGKVGFVIEQWLCASNFGLLHILGHIEWFAFSVYVSQSTVRKFFVRANMRCSVDGLLKGAMRFKVLASILNQLKPTFSTTTTSKTLRTEWSGGVHQWNQTNMYEESGNKTTIASNTTIQEPDAANHESCFVRKSLVDDQLCYSYCMRSVCASFIFLKKYESM